MPSDVIEAPGGLEQMFRAFVKAIYKANGAGLRGRELAGVDVLEVIEGRKLRAFIKLKYADGDCRTPPLQPSPPNQVGQQKRP